MDALCGVAMGGKQAGTHSLVDMSMEEHMQAERLLFAPYGCA